MTTSTVPLPRVTVIVPCRNEARYISVCLESILATEYPLDRLEVLVVDGQSDDGTREIVTDYAARHPLIQLLDNPQRVVPAALNIGIRAARGSVIARMDAHVIFRPEYLPRLVAALFETGADNVGACITTVPSSARPVAQAVAIALAHPFGVGNSYFRIGAARPRWVDTVPFGCYRREVFERVGMFDEDLVRNQDDEFNHRLIRFGGRILLLPEVFCYYYARDTRRQVARMYYQYGFFKPLVARKLGRVMTLRQLVPPAFVLGLVLTVVAALVWPAARPWAGAYAGAYVLAVAGCAAGIMRSHGLRCAIALVTVFPMLHAGYGLGFLRGLWVALRWRTGGNVNDRGNWAGRDPAAIPLSR